MSITGHDSEIYILKAAAAARQLNAAIRMLLADEDQLAIHTVASAAYQILRNLKKQRGRDDRYEGFTFGLYSVAKLLEDGKIDKIPESLVSLEADPIVNFLRKGIRSGQSWHDLQVTFGGDERECWSKFNETANYLKHADKDSDRTLDVTGLDKKNEELLLRASSAYVDLMSVDTPEVRALVVYLHGDKPGWIPWLTPEFIEKFAKLSREQRRLLCIENYGQRRRQHARNSHTELNMPAKLDSSAPHIVHPENFTGPFKDWGAVSTMIEGASHTSGIVIHKGADGESETGIWICTPGHWNCLVTRDEFCHFLLGRCTYTHESGEAIEIVPGTAAFFPQGWRGTCRVHETVRKVYMIR